jgi:hypothetical protein
LRLTFTARATHEIIGFNRRAKQNDSTRNFEIQPTSWNKHHGRAITNKTVAGLHSSKTLVNIPKHHLPWKFTSGQQSWTSRTTPKDTKTNILEKPFTMAKTQRHREQHPEEETVTNHSNINGDQKTTSITTHIAKMPKHATNTKQTRIQKTTLRNEAYADVRRERRSHNFNNGGTQESRLRRR